MIYTNVILGMKEKVLEMDSTDLELIADNTYDYLISCHNLEHIANPLKAIKEWLRILKKDSYIILILPNKNYCFDHKRNYTSFSTLLDKYNRNVGEDNLESLTEILELHDLSLDRAAGTKEQFTLRSLDNFNNRCLHHHVFNLELVQKICEFFNLTLNNHLINGLDMWFIINYTL